MMEKLSKHYNEAILGPKITVLSPEFKKSDASSHGT
jgi:hypothetical protein